ncbi:OmpH family outer membrane protein [Primorskyibacter flagellatus]|uniref:Periplasmic chaperone for outer membrane proteins Skp n=1 Tax=Primorskyibacter flagellatus TaxID=1387277 RepID=A0A1W1Z7G3_9RHOB|nr:OmpH family outer membrane protein [Primorskyibacter flagellatus]SMC43858.1 periplasmic chaperone for outer membrane proteins Skp [Primorskyibacter flagellatus]
MMLRKIFGAAALAAALFFGYSASAQDMVKSPILTVEADRLFNESLYGQRLADKVEAEGLELSSQNRQIEAELTAEEKRLTERRSKLTPAEFRALADAFDEKVQRIREEQDAKGRAFAGRTDEVRRVFLAAAQPVLGELMREAGAAVLVERRSVFLSADAIDITDEAITQIDQLLGNGTDKVQPAPDGPVPDPVPPAEGETVPSDP